MRSFSPRIQKLLLVQTAVAFKGSKPGSTPVSAPVEFSLVVGSSVVVVSVDCSPRLSVVSVSGSVPEVLLGTVSPGPDVEGIDVVALGLAVVGVVDVPPFEEVTEGPTDVDPGVLPVTLGDGELV
jgi:hypothetical protein